MQDAPPVQVYTPPARIEDVDAQACANLNQVVAAIQPELPKMVDAITRVDGVSVFCSLRTFSNNKTLLINLDQMREGWQERKQAQFKVALLASPWPDILIGSAMAVLFLRSSLRVIGEALPQLRTA